MSKMKDLDDIAQGIADITKELMYDSVDWQLSEYEAEGDNYNAMHSHVMNLAIRKLYEETKEKVQPPQITASTNSCSGTRVLGKI